MNRFDQGAATYDARSGIPVERRAEIVRALAQLSGLAAGDVVLELGAGTGQLGACFPAFGLQYVGLDTKMKPFVLSGSFASGFSMALMAKDLNPD